MNLNERTTYVAAEFERRFDAPPELWSRAPGRVDLMGSHTDYNMGYVMTMTIDRDTWVAARPRLDRHVAVHSLNLLGWGEFALDAIGRDPAFRWTDYVRGVAHFLKEAGCPRTGFDGLVHSTVPMNSGLGSSAALELAVAVLFRAVSSFHMDPVSMAVLCQRAENRFVGVNCGILDQYSSAMGQAGCAILLDCRHLTGRPVPIASGIQVVICDTCAPRALGGTEYAERRAQCEEGARLLAGVYPGVAYLRDVSMEQFEAQAQVLPDVVARRCRFIIEENTRVLELAEALPAGDAGRLRELCAASYAGARDLYEIGAAPMAALMEAMMGAPGVIAARQAGAGFGGSMVALVEEERVGRFAQHVGRAYAESTGCRAAVYPVRPAAGAGLL